MVETKRNTHPMHEALHFLAFETVVLIIMLISGCRSHSGISGHGHDALMDDWSWDDAPGIFDFCGNGVIDAGEECDDGNRLNGDGCDWLCRLGDGVPPDTTPLPDTPPVEPGDEVPIVLGEEVISNENGISLEWNGSQYSLLAFLREGESVAGRFRRFDATGTELENEWDFVPEGSTETMITVDHVWSGSEYGVFYASEGLSGIWFVRVDETGKRLSNAVLVVDEPGARQQASAWDGDAFGLSWIVFPEPIPVGCEDVIRPLYFSHLSERGSLEEGTITILSEHAGQIPGIIWGDDGAYRITHAEVYLPDPMEACLDMVNEYTVLPDGTVLESKNIGDGRGPSIAWREGEYTVAFQVEHGDRVIGNEGIYVARFTAAGHLEEAPYRINDDYCTYCYMGTRIVADPYGYGIVWPYMNSTATHQIGLILARLDPRGRVVGETYIVTTGAGDPAGISQYDLVWGDGGFAVAYSVGDTQYFRLYR
jgi:cysteine-rich repeat protein